MKNSDYIKYEEAISRLNQEYRELIESEEYITGKRIIKYKNTLKRFDFAELFQLLKKRRKIIKAGNLFTDIHNDNYENLDKSYALECKGERTISVYTCIVGKYDIPVSPLLTFPDYRYVLFTDQNDLKVDGWEVTSIPEKLRGKEAWYINRYMKFHPYEFFDTDYSFYMDGNVRLLTGLDDFIQCVSNKSGLAMFTHPDRCCLYREAEICLYMGKGNSDGIKKQMDKYKSDGFPYDFGLIEATVILADLHNLNSRKILIDWWDEFIRSESKRDQLSLPYVLWKNHLNTDDIGIIGKNIRKDNHLQVSFHTVKNKY